jgi:hypothetical protein
MLIKDSSRLGIVFAASILVALATIGQLTAIEGKTNVQITNMRSRDPGNSLLGNGRNRTDRLARHAPHPE